LKGGGQENLFRRQGGVQKRWGKGEGPLGVFVIEELEQTERLPKNRKRDDRMNITAREVKKGVLNRRKKGEFLHKI